jgi:D-arabinose 1-dehydrogenase-like Zn-dependent alcohol dehydrogenase
MGTREELLQLLEFMESSDVRPVIDEVRPLAEARQAFERLQAGGGFGKQVFTV